MSYKYMPLHLRSSIIPTQSTSKPKFDPTTSKLNPTAEDFYFSDLKADMKRKNWKHKKRDDLRELSILYSNELERCKNDCLVNRSRDGEFAVMKCEEDCTNKIEKTKRDHMDLYSPSNRPPGFGGQRKKRKTIKKRKSRKTAKNKKKQTKKSVKNKKRATRKRT